MNRRRILGLAIAAIAIVATWYVAAPLFLSPRSEVPAPAGFTEVVKQGAWKGADDFHFARGAAKLLSDGQGHAVLRVEDFAVRNGPDIEFFLSQDAEYDATDIGLGDVTATEGSYNVPIPGGADIRSVDYVIIWCVPFSVLFATARLA